MFKRTPLDTATPQQLYLDLLKRALTRIGFEPPLAEIEPVKRSIRRALFRPVATLFRSSGIVLARREAFDFEQRAAGIDWPAEGETMIGLYRLDNLQSCIETVIHEEIPGDLIETGVWRGGATIFMRAVLAAYGVTDRTVWVADSFQGLPKPDAARYPVDNRDKSWKLSKLAIPLEEVQSNFEAYGLLDDQVRFLPGWFRDTLPVAPIEKLAVLRLDGDMYESTMDALVNLYARVSPGGFVIIDDYSIESCRAAVEDFRRSGSITEPLEKIDWTGVFWRKDR